MIKIFWLFKSGELCKAAAKNDIERIKKLLKFDYSSITALEKEEVLKQSEVSIFEYKTRIS